MCRCWSWITDDNGRVSEVLDAHAVTKNRENQYGEWHLLLYYYCHQKQPHTNTLWISVFIWTHHSHHTSILCSCSSSCKGGMIDSHIERCVWSLRECVVTSVTCSWCEIPSVLCPRYPLSIYFTHMYTHSHSMYPSLVSSIFLAISLCAIFSSIL